MITAKAFKKWMKTCPTDWKEIDKPTILPGKEHGGSVWIRFDLWEDEFPIGHCWPSRRDGQIRHAITERDMARSILSPYTKVSDAVRKQYDRHGKIRKKSQTPPDKMTILARQPRIIF